MNPHLKKHHTYCEVWVVWVISTSIKTGRRMDEWSTKHWKSSEGFFNKTPFVIWENKFMLKKKKYCSITKLWELVNDVNTLDQLTSLFESACVCYNFEVWLLSHSLSVLSGLCDWRKSVIMEATDSGLLRWMWWSPSMSIMVACRGVR